MSDSPTRDQYSYFLPIQTRWMDNDAYGHINNVTYYSYFDSVANVALVAFVVSMEFFGSGYGLAVHSVSEFTFHFNGDGFFHLVTCHLTNTGFP